MKLLIVDDEPELITVLCKSLRKKGHTIETAANGVEAWNIIEAHSTAHEQGNIPFDVILTDHRMPQMNGTDFIKKLRHHGFTVPVIMMSGDKTAEQDTYIQAQVFELIAKPMRQSTLLRVLALFENNQVPQPVATNADLVVEEPDRHVSGNARILVVDDEPEICEVLCKILNKEAYETVRASDGVVALDKWHDSVNANAPYDLLITDLKMPRMDGATLLGEIRKTAPLLPVIVLTGHADPAEAYALLKTHQIADFHNKPLKNARSLLFSVKSALEKAQLQRNLIKVNQQYLTLNTELEARVAQRTQELEVQTNRANLANQAKSAFLSRMSHEMRPPLNAILGFTQLQELQLHKKNYDKIQECLPMVIDAGRHLLRMVDDTLDIENVENGELDISLRHCELGSFINSSFAQVELQAEKAGLTWHCDNTELAVLADEARLKQILVNLFSNAVKFNREGGCVIIKVAEVEQSMVEICVSDNGVGIAGADLPLLFEPFTRLKYADEHEIDGVGNGLAICKLLAVQMGGDIEVKSVVDQGSEFKLQLPQSKAAV